jgi:hypothetical protein
MTAAPNRERIALLAADLESGEFPQDTGRLRSRNGYCCLGVACERYRRETGDGQWQETYNGTMPSVGYSFVTDGIPEAAVLPRKVADWYGLELNPPLPGVTIPAPLISEHGAFPATATRATHYNDDLRAGFTRIAAAFRARYLQEGDS